MKQFFKKRGGVIGDLINGTGGLIIGIVIVLIILSTLIGANLLTANSAEDNVTDQLMANFTTGISNVSNKIPTILLIAAVVLLVGVLVLLVVQAKKSGMWGNSGSI